jgi:MFS family permease
MLSEISKSQKIFLMLGVMSAMLLSSLDQTIIATAMPKIVHELNGLEHLSWVFTAYLLASTIVVPIAGKISDIYGRKIFYIVSITIFLLGSILSGLAQSMTQLIFFRAIQGIGAGAIMANSFTIVGDLFPPRERGKWQGMLGSVFALSSITGPMLGGWLTDNASWRWTFFINMPIGVLALILVYCLMPKFTSAIKDKIMDYKGSFTLTIGLITFLLGFVWGGNQYSWNSIQIIGLFIISIISFFAFVRIERKAKEPILPLSLFQNSIFSVSILIVFLIAMGMFGAILYIPIFAQVVLGVSATSSGTMLTPMMLSNVFASVIAGQIISRTGKYKLLTIFSLTIILIALLLLSMISYETTRTELILESMFLGMGIGMGFPVFAIAVQNAFEYSKLGVATASTQLFRSIGGTVGVAIMGTILNNSLSSKLSVLSSESFVQNLSKFNINLGTSGIDINRLQDITSAVTKVQFLKDTSGLPLVVRSEMLQAFSKFNTEISQILASSIANIFLISFFLTLIAFVAAFFLREIPLRKSHVHKPILEKAGIEIAVEEGDFRAKDTPRI